MIDRYTRSNGTLFKCVQQFTLNFHCGKVNSAKTGGVCVQAEKKMPHK